MARSSAMPMPTAPQSVSAACRPVRTRSMSPRRSIARASGSAVVKESPPSNSGSHSSTPRSAPSASAALSAARESSAPRVTATISTSPRSSRMRSAASIACSSNGLTNQRVPSRKTARLSAWSMLNIDTGTSGSAIRLMQTAMRTALLLHRDVDRNDAVEMLALVVPLGLRLHPTPFVRGPRHERMAAGPVGGPAVRPADP